MTTFKGYKQCKECQTPIMRKKWQVVRKWGNGKRTIKYFHKSCAEKYAMAQNKRSLS